MTAVEKTGVAIEELVKLGLEAGDWADEAFGTPAMRGPTGPLKHLLLEVEEVKKNPRDHTEYADCLLLVLDSSRRAGVVVAELALARASLGMVEAAAPLDALNKWTRTLIGDTKMYTAYPVLLTLVFCAAACAGLGPLELVRAAHAKLQVNKRRTWGKPTSDEPVLHTREYDPNAPVLMECDIGGEG